MRNIKQRMGEKTKQKHKHKQIKSTSACLHAGRLLKKRYKHECAADTVTQHTDTHRHKHQDDNNKIRNKHGNDEEHKTLTVSPGDGTDLNRAWQCSLVKYFNVASIPNSTVPFCTCRKRLAALVFFLLATLLHLILETHTTT